MTEDKGIGHPGGMSPAHAVPIPEPGARAAASLNPPTGVHETRASAFRRMYEAQLDFVWRNLRRLGVSEADVDDKAQEVFVVAHRRFADFEERGHGPRAWLFQIVLRVASDARRHRRRHPVDPDGGVAQERQSMAPNQADSIDVRQQLDLLDRALRTLDLGKRAVLLLHEVEEMTAPEVADVLGIPSNTVYSRLRVASSDLEEAASKLRREQLEARNER